MKKTRLWLVDYVFLVGHSRQNLMPRHKMEGPEFARVPIFVREKDQRDAITQNEHLTSTTI